MNKEEWEEYITWEERVTDKLERWVKYNKPITREQAEETIDFICEQDNVIDRKIRELERYKNIIDELKEDIPCLLEIINRNEKDIKVYQDEWIAIKSVENKLKELKGSDEK